VDRVKADLFLVNLVRQSAGGAAQARLYASRALELARQLGDAESVAEAAFRLMYGTDNPPEHHDERLRVAEAIAGDSFVDLSTPARAQILHASAFVYLTWDDRRRAEELWSRVEDLAERSRDAQLALWPLQHQALRQTLDGELEATLDTSSRLLALGSELGREGAGRQFASRSTRRALLYLGRAEESLRGIPVLPNLWFGGGPFSAQRVLFLAHAGQASEARDLLQRLRAERDFASPDDASSAAILRYLLEASVLLEDREVAAALSPRFAPLAGLLHTEADMVYCIGRLLGGAARLLGRPDEARGYYRQALEICERVRFRPEIALTRLELAELLLEHYPTEQSQAQQHLDFAIDEFRVMKMQPALERALRHKGLLKA
jgi:hypothetical protein